MTAFTTIRTISRPGTRISRISRRAAWKTRRFSRTIIPASASSRHARKLPFADNSYDFVHSSAVIEHVGSHRDQTTFLGELWRVSRRGIFVTTPNRWFPIEFHTVLPLIHYLPPDAFRAILRRIGRDFFADEANLNLMSRSTLADAAQSAGMTNFRIESVMLLGWSSNLLLIASKEA